MVTDIFSEELAFILDQTSGVPYYRQIIKQVEIAIVDGRLSKGVQLPTVRSLAVALKINPNTVARAYNELEIRGIVHTQQGTGTFIRGNTTSLGKDERSEMLNSLVRTFLSNASSYGFGIDEIIDHFVELKKKESDS